MLSKSDRQIFSLKIVSADNDIKNIDSAKAQLVLQQTKLQQLDDANNNLLIPVNSLVGSYQLELTDLDGKQRTTFIEQDILDSANHKITNKFFPSDETVSPPIPGLANSIWTQAQPYALGYAIGADYKGDYVIVTKEPDLLSSIVAYIANAAAYTDTQLTTGLDPTHGTCSDGVSPDQATCEAVPAVWTSAEHTLLTNLLVSVNSLKSLLESEVTLIVTNDTNSTRQAQNNAAINDINNVILPAITTWLAYPEFSPSNTPPTKLHSTQLTAFSNAINARSSFVSTRLSQLQTNVGTLSQNLTTGDVTGSGMYLSRYNYLSLRLNAFGGSLSQLTGIQMSTKAQDSLKANLISTKATYMGIVPTSLFKAAGNGTDKISLIDNSLFSVGDNVFVMAEGQEELQRSIKSITGDLVTLNDIIPAKYRPSEKARLYKDLT